MGTPVKVLDKGKITIPVRIRNRLAISEGDTLTLEVRGGHLVLLPQRTVLEPTEILRGLAEDIEFKEPVKKELRKASAYRIEKKSKKGSYEVRRCQRLHLCTNEVS